MPNNAFGIYIHWPFCSRKCPYCDFNSHIQRDIDEEAFCAFLVQEIRYFAARLGIRRATSVFFGGGTPSLMSASSMAQLIKALHDNFTIDEGCEISLEANPASAEADKFMNFADLGVNRISLGMQSLRNKNLKFLGRLHSAEEALLAWQAANRAVERVNMDYIYALPHQTSKEWSNELSEILALGPGHLSIYELTIEPNTLFFSQKQRGELDMPDDELGAELYEISQELCNRAGLPAYEISNHAVAGNECRHNELYWQYGEYIGIGPGAHGRLHESGHIIATETIKSPRRWMEAVRNNGHGLAQASKLDASVKGKEYLLMGLRHRQGISKRAFADLSGSQLNTIRLEELQDLGVIKMDTDSVYVTPQGRLILNRIISELTEDL